MINEDYLNNYLESNGLEYYEIESDKDSEIIFVKVEKKYRGILKKIMKKLEYPVYRYDEKTYMACLS